TGCSGRSPGPHECTDPDHQWGRTRRPEPGHLNQKRKRRQQQAAGGAIGVESSEPQFVKVREGSLVTGKPRSFHSGNPPSRGKALYPWVRRRITASSANTQ